MTTYEQMMDRASYVAANGPDSDTHPDLKPIRGGFTRYVFTDGEFVYKYERFPGLRYNISEAKAYLELTDRVPDFVYLPLTCVIDINDSLIIIMEYVEGTICHDDIRHELRSWATNVHLGDMYGENFLLTGSGHFVPVDMGAYGQVF